MTSRPLHLLALHFRVLEPIRKLPHFHGPQWSALFRGLLKLNASDKIEHGVQPIETGILEYEPGENITLGLLVPQASACPIHSLLENFNEVTGTGQGHFQPGVTVNLDAVTSRLSGNPWSASDPPIEMADLETEIEHLQALESFTIETLSPLRIPRPSGRKKKGHKYCDADFFLTGTETSPIVHFINKLGEPTANRTGSLLTIDSGALTWLDSRWGKGKKNKTLGGVVGALDISGRPSRWEAERLILGQYEGIGKNRTFGLGYYRIPQLDQVRQVVPLTRTTTLLGRAIEEQALADALARLSGSAPGPDRMTLADAKAAGPALLQALRKRAMAGPEKESVTLRRQALPKSSGGQRFIHIQNLDERILHRAFADVLNPVIDGLLSASAYAYRRGLSRQNAARVLSELLAEGYDRGIKADIAAFFDSVNTTDLCRLLTGLLPDEPLTKHLCSWLVAVNSQGINGLPQGWSLSPLLSNLYLDRFDRKMAAEGFRLVRFSDDFVALCRGEGDTETCIRAVEDSLTRLGLSLNPDKTMPVSSKAPIPFLGYLVSQTELLEAQQDDKLPEDAWDAVFRPEWRQGLPVYLTSICRGAYSSGPHLMIKRDDEQSESIPWSRVSRVVIVGRSTFSGGVIYRAVRERIPVTFIDVMGKATGRLNAPDAGKASMTGAQERKQDDPAWILEFARRQIAAKINNSSILLRRNGIHDPFFKEMETAAAENESLASLRGIEGTAAKAYFDHFAGLTAPFEFTGRVYHPPDGPVNVLLSFGYTLLYNRLAITLRDKGFNPRLGFFHAGRGRHAALASDLMEPLRHIIDRIVLSLIHLDEITPDDFVIQELGNQKSCRLNGKGFRSYINRYEWTMASQFTPVRGQKKMSYNQWLDETVDDLRRSISFGLPCRPLRIS